MTDYPAGIWSSKRRTTGWFVRNLASKNGTLVNGVLVKSRHCLEPGDRITASCVAMTFSAPSTGTRHVRFEPPSDAREQLSAESTSLEEVLSSGRSDTRVAPAVATGPQVSALWAFVRAGRELAVRRPLPEVVPQRRAST